MTDIGLSAPHSTQCSSRREFLICPLMLQECAFRYFWPFRSRKLAVGRENFLRYNIPTVQGGVPMTVKEISSRGTQLLRLFAFIV
jgi:hypothetical protein